MGNKFTRSKTGKNQLPENSRFVVQFVCGKCVPSADLSGESDPYIVAYFVPKANDPKAFNNRLSRSVETLIRLDDPNPVFNSYHNFYIDPPPSSFLHVEIYDHDLVTSDDIVGYADIPVGALANDEVQYFSFSFTKFGDADKNPDFGFLMRRLYVDSPAPTRKTFFIIRHGESKWNEAEKHHDIAGLIHHDHALDKRGIEQAEGLNARWKAARDGSYNDDGSHFIELFLKATDIFASPLTRAIETAFAALEGHPTIAKKGIRLMSAIREVKNLGGMDTVGVAYGEDIMPRVISELASEVGAERAAQLTDGIAVDVGDACSPWWNVQSSYEDASRQAKRVQEFLNFVHYDEADVSIFVGHSLFFKKFYSEYISDHLKVNKPDLARQMSKYKLDNAALMGVVMEFPADGSRPSILDCQLMFGGAFANSASSPSSKSSKK